MPVRTRRIVIALIAALLVSVPAAGQNTGSLSGTIVDNSGQVVPGATITLINERTADARTMPSGARGEFAFHAVPPGSYTVKVELTGFRSLETRNNVLNANGQLDLGQLKLDVGTLTELVTVVSEGSVVETKNSDYSGLLTSNQISQIQTKGRDVMSLLRLLPGVRYENDIEAMGDSFGSNVPNIGGQRRAWNQVTVDGLNGNELSGTARFSSAINLDAIAEVKVLLNTYKAEFGRTGGANVQIVSKSGSTNYRGSGYWYGRRDAWNATPWENNRTAVAKPKLHIDTPGFNLGGPLKIPGLFNEEGEKRWFFFYSLEAPQVQRPGQLRLYRMPTELERRGDFSQTRTAAGALIFIKDPANSAACSATTGGAGCFPNNVIPSNRIDSNTLRLLNSLPMPNRLDHNATANWNFTRQETADNPRWNNLLRIDSRPSSNDSFWGVLRTFNSNQYGSEITAGPAKWGFFDGSYLFSDSSVNGGWNRVFGSSKVNEFQIGIRRQTEGFQTHAENDWSKVRRSDIGWTVPQYFPEVNTLDVMPRVTFGLGGTGIDSPDFTFDQRLGETAQDWLFSLRDNFSWAQGTHTFKAGGYYEFMKNNEARGGAWMGEFTFNNNTNNPLNTNHAYANALLGVFGNYQETATPGSTRNRAWMSEWYVQDTWQANARLTMDFGARFLWYAPYVRADDRVSNFDPDRFDPARAPRLYQPALINGTRVAFDAPTNTVLPTVYIGAYVPGTGDQTNGLVNAGDGVSRGFRERLAPQIEPRVGITWDLTGEGTTVVHASAGMFHNARLGGGSFGNLRNPPFFVTPALPNASIATMFAPGISLVSRPPNINAITWDYESPSSRNWSIGIRRDIGWGTVVDATYTGSQGRDLEGQFDLNGVPEGARFLDVNPQNDDPSIAGLQALDALFLRPFRGYGNIRVRGTYGEAEYHALQVQANRRYIRGVQFGGAYTWQRSRGTQDEDGDAQSTALSRPMSYFYSTVAQSPTHTLVINYTWDLPEKATGSALVRGIVNGWQISGENAFVSGDWAPIMFTTSDNFDFTGGEGGQGQDVNGVRLVRPNTSGDPMAGGGDPITGWFNTAAFTRPSGRGDIGNSPRNVVQRPGINNWNVALFKNVRFAGTRAVQFRAEVYNVLNHTQFNDIDRDAQFDATGRQIDPNFGTVIGIGAPTRPPRVIQLSLRVNF
jgi:hypothetical protein